MLFTSLLIIEGEGLWDKVFILWSTNRSDPSKDPRVLVWPDLSVDGQVSVFEDGITKLAGKFHVSDFCFLFQWKSYEETELPKAHQVFLLAFVFWKDGPDAGPIRACCIKQIKRLLKLQIQ